MLNSIIIEGIDRLGKDTLISGIKDKFGFFQTIHYQKPELLDCYLEQARKIHDMPDGYISAVIKSDAQKTYQQMSFVSMMKMLGSEVRFIMNRAHLGEFVYAPRYRGYDGSYVFNLEKSFRGGPSFLDNTLLVLLHTSSFDFIKDDGLSFDFSKKDEEQMDFVRAFEKSDIKHKLLLDIHDGSGSFVPKASLLNTVVQAYRELPSLEYQIMHTSWDRSDGNLNRHNILQPDPKKIVN